MMTTTPHQPLQLDASSLEGMALTWAVGLYDQRNVGLAFKLVNGVLCGVAEDGLVCTYLTGPRYRDQMLAQQRLGVQADVAMVYDPQTDWRQAGHFIADVRMELGPDGDTLWRAKTASVELRGQLSPELAVLRTFVMHHAGPTITVPRELVPILSSAAA